MPKRGKPATPKQRAALEAGQKKRAAARKALRDEAHAQGMPTAGERWSMLLDGTLTVRDLTDKEIDRMKLLGSDGTLSGRPRAIPSHIAQQFAAERIRRANAIFQRDVKKAAQLLGKVIDDPEASRADQLRAAGMLLDRALGKTPETVHVKTDDPFGNLIANGGVLKDVRDLSDLEQA